jgi:hypothetical protein
MTELEYVEVTVGARLEVTSTMRIPSGANFGYGASPIDVTECGYCYAFIRTEYLESHERWHK